MAQEIIEAVRDRFSLADKNKYIIQGNLPRDCEVEVYLDQEKQENFTVKRDVEQSAVEIQLPEDLSGYKKLSVFVLQGGRKLRWFSGKTGNIQRRRNMPQYFVDYLDVDFQRKKCTVSGWAVYQSPLDIYVTDNSGNKLSCRIERVNRADVQEQFQEWDVGKYAGFLAEIPFDQEKSLRLVFQGEKCRTIRRINLQKSKIMGEKAGKYCQKGMRYLRAYGMSGFTKKILKKAEDYKNRPYPYVKWISQNLPGEGELEAQRKTAFSYTPLISIVIPLYNTPIQYLDELLKSVTDQTYGNFQLCLADGSDNDRAEEFIKKSYGEDSRILYKRLESNDGISENTNRAIEMASGDYIMFSDHDDTLAPNALYEIVKEINENPGTDIVYTDEDKVTMDGGHFFDPHFKPDFNLDMLRCNNYICHIFVVKKEIQEKVGMLRKEYDGAQDYDFILRCCEQAQKIRHVPKILYHWRNHPASTAGNPESKMYAYEAGRAAVQAHYDRLGIKAKVSMTENWGRYRTELAVEGNPLISIIIPNKDHREELERCINSIYEKSTYRNFEIIIVENNSTNKEIFHYYRQLESQHDNIKVLEWKGEFNYSGINNFAAEAAGGEYLLLLNNDIEVITENWLEEMLSYCQREDVGIVGAKLLYPNDKIQHAGVIIGMGPSRTAGHIFYNFPRDQFVYAGRTQTTQDLSAVTAACMMTKKSLFYRLHGLDDRFQVAFNDIDYCLRMRQLGKLVVYQAYAELYHYESLTRGDDKNAENKKRFSAEVKLFKKRWGEILKKGDPYYNPNLSLARSDCSLRKKNE